MDCSTPTARISSVIAMAKTPSLNASTRPVSTGGSYIGRRSSVQIARRLDAPRAPQQGMHAPLELEQAERLQDVIIGPEVQRPRDVGLVRARAEEEHRHVAAVADLAQDFDSGDVRHHHVEYYELLFLVREGG